MSCFCKTCVIKSLVVKFDFRNKLPRSKKLKHQVVKQVRAFFFMLGTLVENYRKDADKINQLIYFPSLTTSSHLLAEACRLD